MDFVIIKHSLEEKEVLLQWKELSLGNLSQYIQAKFSETLIYNLQLPFNL